MFINKIINRHEMAAKDTTFVREIPSETIFTEIDPDKMTQVFDNVITNAMKYSRGENVSSSTWNKTLYTIVWRFVLKIMV